VSLFFRNVLSFHFLSATGLFLMTEKALCSWLRMVLHSPGSGGAPFIKHFVAYVILCHVPRGVTSSFYCNRKYCTFSVTSTVISYLRRVHRTVYNKCICNFLGSVILLKRGTWIRRKDLAVEKVMSSNSQRKSNKMQQCIRIFISYLYEAQHVSGDTPPIIRSLKLH